MVDIVFQRRCKEAIHFKMMAGDGFTIQSINHHWRYCYHSRIDGTYKPGGPAALGSAGYNEALHFVSAACRAGSKFLNSIHCTHTAFHHCQPHQPSVVFGFKMFHTAVGDQVVFLAAHLLGIVEMQGLVGNHSQLSDNGSGIQGHACDSCRSDFRCRVKITARPYEEETRPSYFD